MNQFKLRRCDSSSAGTFFDVLAVGSEHPVATVALKSDRPQLLEVVHPRPINRVDGEVSGPERELIGWLSDLTAVNAALAAVSSGPVGSVGWDEWVRCTRGIAEGGET